MPGTHICMEIWFQVKANFSIARSVIFLFYYGSEKIKIYSHLIRVHDPIGVLVVDRKS